MTRDIPSKEAIEYGRRCIIQERDKLREWEAKAKADGKKDLEMSWRKMANMIDMRMLGYGGCVITAFDERWLDDGFRKMMSEVRELG